MDKELIKVKLIGMETALIEYHKLGKEFQALCESLTNEEKQTLENDKEISSIADRLDVLHEEVYEHMND